MDISLWRNVANGTNCRLVAGAGKPGRRKFNRTGLVDDFPAHLTNHLEHLAVAWRLYEQGADGIFFYNFVIRAYEPK